VLGDQTGRSRPGWERIQTLDEARTDERHEWKRLYCGRAAVEREFGRLKMEYGLTPLRTRGLARVAVHADLTMIARLGQALSRVRSVRLAA
jgi:hypothetical protein